MKKFTHKPLEIKDDHSGHDHGHDGGHEHDHSGHDHGYKSMTKKRLVISIVITLVIMVVEIIGGIMSNSVALLSDAGHMFTHVFALGISLGAIIIASRDPHSHRTFGLYRAEIIAALFNSLFLFGVTALILWESVELLINPEPVESIQMLLVGLIGLVVNIISIALLVKSAGDDINVKAAFVHIVSDAASSVGVVAGAIVIYYTGWSIIDPIIAIGIALVIAVWAVGLFKDAINVLLETAPKGMDVDTLHDELIEAIPEICEIYDMHIWVITTNMYMFSAHIALERKHLAQTNEIREQINKFLFDKHKIDHTTVEFDIEEECSSGRHEEQEKKED